MTTTGDPYLDRALWALADRLADLDTTPERLTRALIEVVEHDAWQLGSEAAQCARDVLLVAHGLAMGMAPLPGLRQLWEVPVLVATAERCRRRLIELA